MANKTPIVPVDELETLEFSSHFENFNTHSFVPFQGHFLVKRWPEQIIVSGHTFYLRNESDHPECDPPYTMACYS
jgi:hypothetical protein